MKNLEGLSAEVVTPEITFLEKSIIPGGALEKQLDHIDYVQVRDPAVMKPNESSDVLREATESIIGDPQLIELLVFSVEDNNARYLAEFMNLMTKKCISLSDEQIGSMYKQFARDLNQNADRYCAKYGLRPHEMVSIKTGIFKDSAQNDSNIDGITSAVRYIRNRKKMYDVSPKTIPALYFENSLDYSHGVDLIEVVEGKSGIVINLIQIKSHEYKEEELKRYEEQHKKWVEKYMLSVKDYEQSFFNKPKDERLEVLKEGLGNINEVLFKIMTTSAPLDYTDILYKRLGIGAGFSNTEKMWILDKYLPVIKKSCEEFISTEHVNEETKQKLHSMITELQARLDAGLEKKKGLKKVVQVNSVCSTQGADVRSVPVFRVTLRDSGGKAIKMTN